MTYDPRHRDCLPRQMGHGFVGIAVFMETHRRVLKGEFGTLPIPLKDDAFSQGGYCLDAPIEIPAGGMVREEIGPEPEDWVASQLTIWRDE